MGQQEIRLVVCDIDDTLIQKELHLDERIKAMIRRVQERGIGFTLATGRMPYRAETFAKEAGLTIPYIANNGSILFHRDRMVYSNMLDAWTLKEILQRYMEEDPEFTVVFSYPDRECPLRNTHWIRERRFKYAGYDQILGNDQKVWKQSVHKIYVLDEYKTGKIGRLATELAAMWQELSYFQYGQYSIEIVAKGCSKASGLRTLTEYLGISPSQVMAIGDHTNDIEIVRMAGIGVAVANGDPKLKEAADYVTAGERALGVEEAIDRFLPD